MDPVRESTGIDCKAEGEKENVDNLPSPWFLKAGRIKTEYELLELVNLNKFIGPRGIGPVSCCPVLDWPFWYYSGSILARVWNSSNGSG